MNYVLWLTLFRVFTVCFIISIVMTVVLSIKYRLFSLVRSVADMKKDARKYSDRNSEGSVSVNNTSSALDDVPYFAEISDSTAGQVTRRLSGEEDECQTGTVILSGSDCSVTQITGAEDGNTVVLSSDIGAQTDPEVFVLLKDIKITNGSTDMIKKFR